jgi:glycosyltransferase involved in cell wall biosynthesis
MADAPARQQMASQAYQAWQQHFTWSRIADQYELLYKSLLAGDPIRSKFLPPPSIQ